MNLIIDAIGAAVGLAFALIGLAFACDWLAHLII